VLPPGIHNTTLAEVEASRQRHTANGCWEHAGVDPAMLDPVLLNFDNKRAAQKAKYLGEMFIAGMPNGQGCPFLDFFQVEKSSGQAKGILSISLAPLRGATP